MKKYKINFLPFAQEDLNEIVSYYFEINRDLSKKIYFQIKNRINELANFPDRGMLVPELEKQGFLKYRQLLEGNYRIIYSINSNQVFIHIIIDSRRNIEEILIKKIQS